MRARCVVLMACLLIGGTERATGAQGTDGPSSRAEPDTSRFGQFIELPVTPRDVRAIPPKDLDAEARQSRRARLRLTAEGRAESGRRFDPLDDLLGHLDWFRDRPVMLSGFLTKLGPAEVAGDDAPPGPLYEGVLSVPESGGRTIHFLVGSLPDGMPTGEALSLPVSLVGYVVEVRPESKAEPVPLLVAWEPLWHRPQFPEDRLQDVKDNTLAVRQQEREDYYALLHHARMVDDEAQQKQARQNERSRMEELSAKERRRLVGERGELKTYVDLFLHPERYRGELVTLTGHARKAIAYPADPMNEYGIDRLYEIWLFTEHSQSIPAVVVSTSVPENMPLGDNISARVSATGYFFKKYVYPSQNEKFRVAPLILAGHVEYFPPTDDAAWRAPWYAAAIIVPLLLAVVGAVWWVSRRDRQARRRRLSKLAAPPETDIRPPDQIL